MEVSTESYKDVIMGGSIFFLTNLRSRIGERIVLASEKAEQVNFKFNRTQTAVQILISTISMIGQVLLLAVTLSAAVLGLAPAGAALSVGNLAGSFFNSSGRLVQCFIAVKTSAPLWKKFQIAASDDKRNACDIAEIPAITLNNVSFQYGDHAVIKNKNYTFSSDGKYAIMGESGSGKSTLAKIMLGLLPGYTGTVRYGEVEQRDANLESLYRRIAYVDQQVYLFQDTVRFNITLGEDYSDEEIAAVIKSCKRRMRWILKRACLIIRILLSLSSRIIWPIKRAIN